MFIINITYKVPLEFVDKHMEAHVQFLNDQYAQGNFLASGRKVPRTGGIILSGIKDKTVLQQVIEKDPFSKHNLADYELIEFTPSKTCKEFDFLKE